MIHPKFITDIKHNIKNIIFDFGGVIFNIDYLLPIQAFKELGFSNFEELYAKAAQSNLFDQLETGQISKQEFIGGLKKLAPELSLTDQQIIEAWNSILLDIPRARIRLIHQLKSKNYKTVLLSNTNVFHVEEFEKVVDKTMGIKYYQSAFDEIYYSNVIGLRKPHPATFLQVCERANLDPNHTLFIDDSLQHVEGAVKAGLFAYHLDVNTEDICDLFEGWV